MQDMNRPLRLPSVTLRTSRHFGAWLVLAAFAVVAGATLAQTPDHAPNLAERADRGKVNGAQQQRRIALRAALQDQREAVGAKQNPPARQLTPAERAKLREQLRQQRRDAVQNREAPAR